MSQQELSNQKPSWSTAAFITGFSAGGVLSWATLCAAPMLKAKINNRNSLVVQPVALATGLYFGTKYTGLSEAEKADYFAKLQAEEDAKAAAKKAKEDAKAAKEAKKNVTL
eukprot:UN01222